MILNICAWEINETKFRVKNTTAIQDYTDASIDYNTFTDVSLTIRKVNDTDNELTVDISNTYLNLFECTGLEMEFSDFGEETFNEYDYWFDYMYEVEITYTYDGTEYTTSATTGFRSIISGIVYQQVQQSDWRKEFACDCNCAKFNTTLRKWHYLQMMSIASDLCLINQYLDMLSALYKITGTTHEVLT